MLALLDLQREGIKPQLWLIANLQRDGKMLKLTTPYVLIVNEFDVFASITKDLETPLGHVLVMAQHIWQKNFGVLKSHDYHVLMQHILLLALRDLLALGP